MFYAVVKSIDDDSVQESYADTSHKKALEAEVNMNKGLDHSKFYTEIIEL